MRLVVVLSLFLALTILATSTPAAASQDASATADPGAQEAPKGSGKLPLDGPWTFLLAVGYISMSLKKQLRRRGYPTCDRTATFADLISLRRRRPISDDQTDHPAGRKPPTTDI